MGWGFGGAPLGVAGACIGGGCGVGVGLGFGAGAGLGSWYIPEKAAFTQEKKLGERLLTFVRRFKEGTK